MILLCGIPSEPPLAMVAEELRRGSERFVWFNQRRFRDMHLEYDVVGGSATGTLQLDGDRYQLEDFQGVYLRTMDDQLLPELMEEPFDSPIRRQSRGIHDALVHWCQVADARVLNRPASQGSNFSKPYQSQLIGREGFSVPEILVTNDPESALEFIEAHGRVIYKSISGLRSIVEIVRPEDLQRLPLIRWCPVQFQAFVDGIDVRVHVVGDRAFATQIRTNATDYRYAGLGGGEPSELRPVELESEVAARCVHLAAALDLPFAGIDLRVSPSGEVFCFEVNPSPAFPYFEQATRQPIARAVARYLAGHTPTEKRAG
jgi:glutathione synthase/RimK-type ligase-like ATP-grasp enzyme